MVNALARPAPPGRPRASQTRSSSGYSLHRQTPPRSPLAESVALPGGEEVGSSQTISSLGLTGDDSLLSETSTVPREIPYEEVEEALRGMSRDDLVLALKRAKEQMDLLDARLDTHIAQSEQLRSTVDGYVEQIATLEGDRDGLQFALVHREERIDDLMRDQDKVEEEVDLKNQIIERLRKQLDETERARAEAERRYTDQTNTIDKERQYYLDTEQRLQTQKAKASSNLERVQSSNQQLTRENDRLQRKVAQLQRLAARRTIVSGEGTETAAGLEAPALSSIQNADADVESDSRESTIDAELERQEGTSTASRSLASEQETADVVQLRDELAKLQTSFSISASTVQQLQSELRDVKAANVELRSQNETFVDLLQEKTISGELITGSAMLNRRYSSVETSETETSTAETSEAEDDVPDVPRVRSRKSVSRRQRMLANASQDRLAAPRTLADELDESETQELDRDARRRERVRERSESLSDDVSTLQKELLELRDANQALTLYITKIVDRIIAREGYEQVLAVDADHERSIRGKPSRAHVREALSTSPPVRQPRASSPSTPTAAGKTPFLKQSQRTMSMDWRSYFPGSGSGAPKPTTVNETTADTSLSSEARRISSSEEVEDQHDERERERIRANLRSQGIVPPEHQLRSHKRASASFGTFFQRVLGVGSNGGDVEGKTSTGSSASNTSGVQHLAPRVTTFDGDHHLLGPPSTSGHSSTISEADEEAEEEKGNDSLSAMRQRALEQGDASGNLTAAPVRRSIIEERRARRSASNSGESASPTLSRQADAALQAASSPTMSTNDGKLPDVNEDVGWRKALRRVSLLAGGVTSPTTNPQADDHPSAT